MEVNEIMEYISKHGEPPKDNLHYIAVDPVCVESFLENCVVFTVLTCKDYTEMLFRHINNIDWYSLHIKGPRNFEMARFTVQPNKKTGFTLRGEK